MNSPATSRSRARRADIQVTNSSQDPRQGNVPDGDLVLLQQVEDEVQGAHKVLCGRSPFPDHPFEMIDGTLHTHTSRERTAWNIPLAPWSIQSTSTRRAVPRKTVKHPEPQGDHQDKHAVPLQLHPPVVPPVGEEHGHHLEPVQRREGDEVEDAQADVQTHHQGKKVQPEGEARRLPPHGRHGGQSPQGQGGEVGHKQVGQGAGQGGDGHPALGVLKIPGGHRHGLGPTEAHHHHHQKAEGVQVAERVQGEAVVEFGGGVPQPIGCQAVAHLVDHQAQQDHHDPQGHGAQAGPVHPLGQL